MTPDRERGTGLAATANVQALSRSFAILRAVAASNQGLRLSDLARAVDLPRSTAHRLVRSLQQEGVVFTTTDGRVRIGPGLVELARTSQDTLIGTAHPLMERLAQEVAETVDLATLSGEAIRFIDQAVGPQRLRATSVVGEAFPAYCTANGKALLAELSPGSLERALPARLARFTPNTITTRKQLVAELERVRRYRVAYDREEHTERICAVGAAVHDALGALGAVTIAAPSERFYGREELLAQALLAMTAELEAALGA